MEKDEEKKEKKTSLKEKVGMFLKKNVTVKNGLKLAAGVTGLYAAYRIGKDGSYRPMLNDANSAGKKFVGLLGFGEKSEKKSLDFSRDEEKVVFVDECPQSRRESNGWNNNRPKFNNNNNK